MPEARIGKFKVKLPRSRLARIVLGSVLIIGGFLGFLPVVGFWMIPLGLMALSYDSATVRRWRRKAVIWWQRRRAKAGRHDEPKEEQEEPQEKRAARVRQP